MVRTSSLSYTLMAFSHPHTLSTLEKRNQVYHSAIHTLAPVAMIKNL